MTEASTALAHRQEFPADQVALIKSQVAPGVTDDELKLFLHVAARSGLDPLAGQIRAMTRRTQVNGQWVNKMSIQTGIDGLRLIAERTDKYRGQLDALWCGDDGEWTDVWLKPDPPKACKVQVLRDDFDAPCSAVALYTEYVQNTRDGKPNRMWSEKPAMMLAKCAEALALRKAFPQEMSGVYTDDEMGKASEPDAPVQGEVVVDEPVPALPVSIEAGAEAAEIRAFIDAAVQEGRVSKVDLAKARHELQVGSKAAYENALPERLLQLAGRLGLNLVTVEEAEAEKAAEATQDAQEQPQEAVQPDAVPEGEDDRPLGHRIRMAARGEWLANEGDVNMDLPQAERAKQAQERRAFLLNVVVETIDNQEWDADQVLAMFQEAGVEWATSDPTTVPRLIAGLHLPELETALEILESREVTKVEEATE